MSDLSAAPAATPAPGAPTGIDVLNGLPAAIADLHQKKQAFEDAKAVLASMRAAWKTATADVEKVFADAEGLVGTLMSDVKNLV